MSVTEQEMRRRLAAEQAAMGSRHAEALDNALQHVAMETARSSDMWTQWPRASINTLGNYLRGVAGVEAVPYNPSPAADILQRQFDMVREGPFGAAAASAPAAAVYQPTASQQELVSRALNLAIPEPAAPAPVPSSAVAPARTPDAGTTTTAEPATVTPVPRPAAAAPAPGSVPASSIGAPPDGAFTVRDRQGLPVPMQCTSGVCAPDIQSGDFYASATQSGLASSGVPSERDRYYDAAIRQMIGGGPQGVLATEAADRAMGVQDLRMSPAYQQQYAQNLRATGGVRDAALALTDAAFAGAAAEGAPRLSLGLAEQDISPAIDNLMSQRAGMAMAIGDPQFSNPVADVAAASGYFGGAGALPYGTGIGTPAVRTQQGIQEMLNVPESYAAPALAQSGGVGALLGRADATEESMQRLLSAAVGSGSASNALTQLRVSNPALYQQMIYEEELARARGRSEGRGAQNSLLELLQMQAER